MKRTSITLFGVSRLHHLDQLPRLHVNELLWFGQKLTALAYVAHQVGPRDMLIVKRHMCVWIKNEVLPCTPHSCSHEYRTKKIGATKVEA